MIIENKKFDEQADGEISLEITLTDDLADSLVNPPIDQEVCDDSKICIENHPENIVGDNLSGNFSKEKINIQENLHGIPKENIHSIYDNIQGDTINNCVDSDNVDIEKEFSQNKNYAKSAKSNHDGAMSLSNTKDGVGSTDCDILQ